MALRNPLLIPFLALLGITVTAAVLWYRQHNSPAGIVALGVKSLTAAGDSADAIRTALDQWEIQTRPNWPADREKLIDHLFENEPIETWPVRMLLSRVSGSDYVQLEDWKRWYENHRRLRSARQPELPRNQALRLVERWQAPIGLTAWFSTILPLDGQIYIASLGSVFGDADDEADAIVRVDGSTGSSEALFTPTGRGSRDVIGIAAADGALFATCSNGVLYCVEPTGALRWQSQHLGAPLVSAPLSVDLNRDQVTDAVVVTAAGKVIGINGANGRNLWVTPIRGIETHADPARLRGTLLAATSLSGADAPLIVVTTPGGPIEVLALANGAARSDAALARAIRSGVLAGTVGTADRTQQMPPAYIGDREGYVWALRPSGQRVDARVAAVLADRTGMTLIAGLRTLVGQRTRPPLLIGCPTGAYGESIGSVCAHDGDRLIWRLGLDAAVWGTPAIAELTGDRDPDIVIGAIIPGRDGATSGALLFVSASGQYLRREVLPAAVECSPVIADIDGDNKLEILVADQAGILHCFGTNSPGPIEWGLIGGDPHNTRDALNAYSFSQRPFGKQWSWRPE